jgi:hypothetical protein
VREDLLASLQHLRSEAKEISRMHAANLQRDMVQLIDFINDRSNQTARKRRELQTTYTRMKKTLDEIHVSPEKGRRKDLRRIEQAIRAMMKLAFSKNANG